MSQGPQTVRVGELDIAYETFGSADRPTILLVMGLATQMLAWDDRFCNRLADEGYHVVRFDNRDIGLSTHLDEAGVPDVMPAFAGQPIEAPYTIPDMAQDAVGLLDALSIDKAHVVGISMGGMIAMELASHHQDRVLSLTSLMSYPNRTVGQATPEAFGALMTPPATTEEGAAERAVAVYSVIGSPGFPLDKERLAERARESFRRSNDPDGIARQLAAILASPDRVPGLRGVTVPSVVVHGEDDILVNIDGGEATAAAIPDARFVRIPGLGHDLPEGAWPQIIGEILGVVRQAENA